MSQGIAEAPIYQKTFPVVCRARETLETTLTLPLSNFEGGQIQDSDSYSYTLCAAPEYEKILDRALVLTRSSEQKIDDTSPCLSYDVRFDPLRPFTCLAELVVEKSSGGCWRFQLVLRK